MGRTPPLSPRAVERGLELAPGHVLASRFEIRAALGEGALGYVYRAFDREAEVDVALKVVREELLVDAEGRQRFLDLGGQLARLNHPNLVRVFRVDADAEVVFVAMQLIEGLTLRESMAKRRAAPEPPEIPEVETFVSQIAAGLADGHRIGPHGDLRPENVILLPNVVKVADFGFSTAVSRAPFIAAATIRGGGAYLAPEVQAGGPPSIAADVYALGVIAAELFTGEVVGPGFAIRSKRPDLPDSLEALIGNCLAEDPAQRIDDPIQLARGIRAHVSDANAALSVATRARSLSVRQSVVGPAPATGTHPPTAQPPRAESTGLADRFISASSSRATKPPTGPTPAPAKPTTQPPLPPNAFEERHTERDPITLRGTTPIVGRPLLPKERGEQSAGTSPAIPIPTDAESPDRTRIMPEGDAVRIAAQSAAQRRPIPLAAWIALILVIVGGATWGAIAFIDQQHSEAERVLLAQREKDRAALEAERARRQKARQEREAAEAEARRKADEAKKKAEEAARLAKEDPTKKAEAERLAEEARKREEERVAIEKKRKEADRAEAEEERRAERDEPPAREEPKTVEAPVAATPPPTTPTPDPTPPHPSSPTGPTETTTPDPTKGTLVAAVVPPVEKKPECPEGMARVKAGSFRMGSAEDDPMRNFSEKRLVWVKTDEYCIDRYEFPNARGARPKTSVNWNVAKSLCESVGKRLCTEKEWERACKGYKGYRFPYGDEFDDSKCNTETKAGEKRGLAAAGSFGGCRSQFGVFDLSGNAAEWTATPLGGGAAMIIKGGASNKPDWAVRCANRGNKPSGSRDAFLGFRCCASPSPQ